MQYTVAHNYRNGGTVLEAGAVVDLDEEAAAFLLRDSPGVLVPVVEVRDVVAPPSDRQVHAPTSRRSRAGR